MATPLTPETFATLPKRTGRRRFLKGLASAGVVTVVGSGYSPISGGMRAWAAEGANNDAVLVSVFLRGAADGLNIVNPYADPDYYAQRGGYGVPVGGFKDLDGFFGLNTAFDPLYELWADGRATFLHATGSPESTRSHFVAQPNMETGLAVGGWMQRAIAASSFTDGNSGMSIGDRVSPQLGGPYSGSVVKTISAAVESGMSLGVIRPALQEMYGAAHVPSLESSAMTSAFVTIDDLGALNPMPGSFPDTGVGKRMREAASIIKGDIGIRCVAIDSTGWDHHSNGQERLQTGGEELSAAIRSFFDDLGEDSRRVIMVVSSEFGRTVKANGSNGTDHGRGNMMMVIGDPLAGQSGGGPVLVPGGWPGLADEQLYAQRDLQVTTDFRSVYTELARRHLGIADTSSVFPGFSAEPVGLLPVRGDVNSSGSADVVDALLVAQHSVGAVADGGPGPHETGFVNARAGDFNRDGSTNIVDALLIAQCSVGVDRSGYCE